MCTPLLGRTPTTRTIGSGRNQGKRSYGDNVNSNATNNKSSPQALVAQDGLEAILKKWEESSKNLDELLNGQMSARDKTGLGYGTQLNEMSNNSETNSEISLSVFDVRSSDEENTPANDKFSKADGFHAIPPPITGNLLTPRANISFAGKTNEAKIVYESVNRAKVIIEDWNSDDKDDVSEVQIVSPVKTNETQIVKTRVDKIGPVSTVIPFAPKIAQTSGAIRPIYPRIDNIMQWWILVAQDQMDCNKLIFQTKKISIEALWQFEVIPKEVHKILMLQVHQKKIKNLLRNTLRPLHPHRTRFLVEDVAPPLHMKNLQKILLKDNEVQDTEDVADKIAQEDVAKPGDATRQAFEEEKRNIASQKRAAQTTSINKLSIGRSSVSTATTPYVSAASTPTDDSDSFSSDGIFNEAYDDENVGAVANFNDMDCTINVSPIPTLRIHKNHPKDQILGDPKTSNCLLHAFSPKEPKNISQALQIKLVEAIQENAANKLQKVWILVDLPSGKKAIGTKWVFKNKRDKRSIVVKNKSRLVAQGFRQEDGIDYDENSTVLPNDVKSAFLYGTIEEEVYVHQPPELLY
ncbi:putative ribonuclease H-like domain-containing protein [Tanacetum coccineum]